MAAAASLTSYSRDSATASACSEVRPSINFQIEAPTAFSTLCPPGILNFLPSPQGLELSHAFLHEVIGLGWYHVSLAASDQTREQRGKQ